MQIVVNVSYPPLQEGEVLNVETDDNGADMTGTWIKADKPVAVFGGSEASNSPNTNKCVKAPGAPSGTCQYQGSWSMSLIPCRWWRCRMWCRPRRR